MEEFDFSIKMLQHDFHNFNLIITLWGVSVKSDKDTLFLRGMLDTIPNDSKITLVPYFVTGRVLEMFLYGQAARFK